MIDAVDSDAAIRRSKMLKQKKVIYLVIGRIVAFTAVFASTVIIVEILKYILT